MISKSTFQFFDAFYSELLKVAFFISGTNCSLQGQKNCVSVANSIATEGKNVR